MSSSEGKAKTYGSSLNENSTSVIKDETTPKDQKPDVIIDNYHDESNDNLVMMVETPQ